MLPSLSLRLTPSFALGNPACFHNSSITRPTITQRDGLVDRPPARHRRRRPLAAAEGYGISFSGTTTCLIFLRFQV